MLVNAEIQIIGTFLLNEYTEYINLLEPGDFQIFPKTMAAIKECYQEEKFVNFLKVAKKSEFHKEELADYVSDTFPMLFKSYYRVLKENSLRTKLQDTVKYSMGKSDGELKKNISQIVNEIETLSAEIAEKETDMCLEYINELDTRAAQDNRMRYGIPKLDYVTGGIKKQEFTVLAARPSVGKSALALQVADNVSRYAKVLFISLEMSKSQIVERLVCKYSDIPHEHLKAGKLEPDEWDDLRESMLQVPNKLTILDRTTTIAGIRNAVEKYAPDLLIVDQIGLVKGEGRFSSKREEIVSITRTLKVMANEYKLAVIGLAQINRGGQDRIPTLGDLKESGSLEEDADNVLIIHKLSEEECQEIKAFKHLNLDNYIAKKELPTLITLAKHRNGEVVTIPTFFIGKRFTFREVVE